MPATPPCALHAVLFAALSGALVCLARLLPDGKAMNASGQRPERADRPRGGFRKRMPAGRGSGPETDGMRLLTARGHALATMLLVALFVLTTLAFHHGTLAGNQYDDSYITYRYAANLAEGKGFTFNSYERVNSASSFLYTMILALAYFLGFTHLELFAGLFGLAMGALVVALAHRAALRLTGRPLLSLLFVAPLCMAGPLTGWALSGMETMLFAALTLAFLHLYLLADAPRWLSFLVLGLALLTRVEAVLLLGLAFMREGLHAWRTRRWGGVGLVAALGLAPFLALLAFNWLYFGNPLPHPLHFKRASVYYSPAPLDHAVGIARFYATYFGAYGVLALGAVLAAAWAALRRRDPLFSLTPVDWLSGWVVLSFLSFLVSPHSDLNRYTVHVIPVLALLALVAWTRLAPRLALRPRLAPAALALALLLVAGGAAASLADTAEQTQRWAEHQEARKRVGLWLRDNAAPGELVASADLGAIAYFARDHDFVDVLGLTTRDLVGLALSDPEAIRAYVAGMRPAYIADTVYPDASGRAVPMSETILRHPQRVYRDVPLLPEADLAPPFERQEVLRLHAGGASFGIYRLDWTPAGHGPAGPALPVPGALPPNPTPPGTLI